MGRHSARRRRWPLVVTGIAGLVGAAGLVVGFSPQLGTHGSEGRATSRAAAPTGDGATPRTVVTPTPTPTPTDPPSASPSPSPSTVASASTEQSASRATAQGGSSDGSDGSSARDATQAAPDEPNGPDGTAQATPTRRSADRTPSSPNPNSTRKPGNGNGGGDEPGPGGPDGEASTEETTDIDPQALATSIPELP